MMALGSIDGRLNDHAIQKPKARILRFIITVQFSNQASAPILCFPFVSVFQASSLMSMSNLDAVLLSSFLAVFRKRIRAYAASRVLASSSG